MTTDFRGDLAAALRLPTRPARSERPHALWELSILVVVLFVYNAVRRSGRDLQAIGERSAAWIVSFENHLGLDFDRPVNQWLAHTPIVAVPSCYYYQLAHYTVTATVLIWVYVRRPAAYRRARWMIVAGTLISLVVYWAVPTAPPRLLPGGGYFNTLADYSSYGWWPKNGGSVSESVADVYTALPSVHFLWALWCGITVFSLVRSRVVRAMAVGYPMLTMFVVIATGNHFVVDVLAALVIGIVVAWCAPAQRSAQRAPGQVPSRSGDGDDELAAGVPLLDGSESFARLGQGKGPRDLDRE